MRKLLFVVLALCVATPAMAASKAYLRKPKCLDLPGGPCAGSVAGDPADPGTIQRSPQITPTVQLVGPHENQFGSFFLEDNATGTVTLSSYATGSDGGVDTTLNTTRFMSSPPGSYLLIRSINTTGPAAGQTAPGSSAPNGQIDWGVLTGWAATGTEFCKSSPPFVCTFINRAEAASAAAVLPSTTHDIGTWNFDAVGSFEGTPYIRGTQDGGISNTLSFTDGHFLGASLPALPLLGFGALALSLAVAGGRSVLRRR